MSGLNTSPIVAAFGIFVRSSARTFSAPSRGPAIGIRAKSVSENIRSKRDVPPGDISRAMASGPDW